MPANGAARLAGFLRRYVGIVEPLAIRAKSESQAIAIGEAIREGLPSLYVEELNGISIAAARPHAIRKIFAVNRNRKNADDNRSEEHTSELQSRLHLVCRLLLDKKQ